MATGGPARLAISADGGELTMALVVGSARHQASQRWDEARVDAAARQIAGGVARGARLADLRTLGEELYLALFPPAIRDELQELEGRALVLELDPRFAAIPWELVYDGRAFLCRRVELARAAPELRLEELAPAPALAAAFRAELERGRPAGAALRRARDAVIAADGEASLVWARGVLHGDPLHVIAPATAARSPRRSARRIPWAVMVLVALLIVVAVAVYLGAHSSGRAY